MESRSTLLIELFQSWKVEMSYQNLHLRAWKEWLIIPGYSDSDGIFPPSSAGRHFPKTLANEDIWPLLVESFSSSAFCCLSAPILIQSVPDPTLKWPKITIAGEKKWSGPEDRKVLGKKTASMSNNIELPTKVTLSLINELEHVMLPKMGMIWNEDFNFKTASCESFVLCCLLWSLSCDIGTNGPHTQIWLPPLTCYEGLHEMIWEHHSTKMSIVIRFLMAPNRTSLCLSTKQENFLKEEKVGRDATTNEMQMFVRSLIESNQCGGEKCQFNRTNVGGPPEKGS